MATQPKNKATEEFPVAEPKPEPKPAGDVITLLSPEGKTYKTSNRAEAAMLNRTRGYKIVKG